MCTLTEYVEEIFQEYLNSTKDELEEAARKLKAMTPAPMNTMLEKQPRGEAMEKRDKRAKMVVVDVPPTNPPGRLRLLVKYQDLLTSIK